MNNLAKEVIPLFATKYASGWPGKADNGVEMMYAELAEILEAEEPTDAHFATYSVPSITRRLDYGAPAQLGRVPIVIAVFDVDAPKATKVDGGGSDRWWAAEKLKLEHLGTDHVGAFTYRTRGGYRAVFRLDRPIFIVDDSDAAAWTALYKAWLAYLERRYGIVGDAKCADWQRLYRLPHATRDGDTPERLETIGDTRGIAAWSPELIAADIAEQPSAQTGPAAVKERASIDVEIQWQRLTPDQRSGQLEKARRIASEEPAAVSGESGHDATIKVAGMICRGCGLPPEQAFQVLRDVYNPRCEPPWTDAELLHKVNDATTRSPITLWSPIDSLIDAVNNGSGSTDDQWTTPTDRALALGNQGQQLPTKFPTLNAATRGGPRAGKLIVVGGAPGAGKTTWATQLAVDYTLDGYGVAIMAADEDADGLLIRIGQQLGFTRESLENGDDATRSALGDRLRALPSLMLIDAEEGQLTLEKVSAELLRRSGSSPSVLVVDSVQTVRVNGAAAAEGPRARIDLVMAALKTAAKQGHLVIATCELARGAYRSQNAADRIDDLAAFKESGGIEYGAAVALVLRSVKDGGGLVDVSIAKNRLGQKPSFRLALDYSTATLREVEMPDPRSASAARDEVVMGKAKAAVMAALLSAKTPTTTPTQLYALVRGRRQHALRAIAALIKEGRIVRAPFGTGTCLVAQLDAALPSEL